ATPETAHTAGRGLRGPAVPEPIDQPLTERLPAGQNPAVGDPLHVGALHLPLRRDHIHELSVYVEYERIENRAVALAQRAEQRPDILVLRTHHRLDPNADLGHQLAGVRYLHDHADRAGDRPGQSEDRVRREGDVVAARGAHSADRRDDRHFIFVPDPAQLLVNALRGCNDA